MKHAHPLSLATLICLITAPTPLNASWIQWCCGRRKKPSSGQEIRAELRLCQEILQEQYNRALSQLRSETQQQINHINKTQEQISGTGNMLQAQTQHIKTLLNKHQASTEQHVQTVLNAHKKTIEQHLQEALGTHQENIKQHLQHTLIQKEGQPPAQPTGRLSGTVKAIAQIPRFTQKDIIGELPDKLALLFAVCKAYRSPKQFPQPPRGLLFEGPPGSGKTFMAEALAGEVQFLYFYQSAPAIHGEYANDGVIYLQEYFFDVYKQARENNKPAIVLIDELDGVGASRETLGQDSAGSSSSKTLLQLMIELIKPYDINQPPVVVIGTTNRVQALDPALKRKDRFDRIIQFQLPDEQQYLQAIKKYKDRYRRCKKGAALPISAQQFLMHKCSLADINFFFRDTDLRAWAASARVATTEHYQQAFDSLIAEKKLETSRGFTHEREELLKDLPLISTYYRDQEGRLSKYGNYIIWHRLCKLMTTKEQWDTFFGSTQRPPSEFEKFKKFFGF